MEKKQVLNSLGLNDNEIKVYLEILKMGSSKVNEIAKRTNLPRTTIYNILDSLIAKGIVSYIVRSGVRYYEAADPKRLLTMQEEKLSNLKSILPELEKIKKSIGKRPFIEIYEGIEGLKTILEEILKMPKKSVLYAYVNNDLFEYLQFYFPHFIERRAKSKIYAKIIQEKSPTMVELRKKEKKLLLNMKFSMERFDSNVFIFEDKVALITFSKEALLGILIEDEKIANTQRQVFNYLWKLAT